MTKPDKDKPAEPVGIDPKTKRAIGAVVAFGALFSLAALVFGGVRLGFSAALGATVATTNLYLLARIVKNATSGRGPGVWGVLGAVKAVALLVVVWGLLKISLVDPIGLVIGFLALPVGIFVSGALAPRD